MSDGIRIEIADQVAGVQFARDRLAVELDAGPSAMSAERLAEGTANLGRIDAALVTLRWLSRSRDSAAEFLASKIPARD